MVERIPGLPGRLLRYHRALSIVLQLVLVALANAAAFLLRFDGAPPDWARQAFLDGLLWLLLIRSAIFVPFRLYQGLWRYTSLYDLQALIGGIFVSSALFFAVMQTPLGPAVYPRSIVIMDALILVLLLGGVRMSRRLLGQFSSKARGRRILIFGAGDAGELIVRDMKRNDWYHYEPVGFIDDDRSKVGLRIHGIPVLGTRHDLPAVLKRHQPEEVLIAIPNAEPAALRAIVRSLEPFKIPIKTLPNLRDIIDGKVEVGQIRTLQVEDLLARVPVGLDREPVRQLLRGRSVMVTGAGGSIGSELCRQIVAFKPASLVLFDRYENGLYAIENALADLGLGVPVTAVVGDVTDWARVQDVLSIHKPEIIFHAAAHKHVPLMEQNPCEAVKNNIYGTRLMSEMAEKHGVDRFIFISTDKAVNPTNVMGASKRVAELLVQSQAEGSGTSFFTVRFGNVLGSNGSVVPRFIEQIKAGGPVTITHPEMRRFFMLIPEAVQLVLHAAAQGQSGQTYVLEMGEQVKLEDMARNLIRLSGYKPDDDIQISYIGLRPGEKLFEELVGEDEVVTPCGTEKIMQVNPRRMPTRESLLAEVTKLETLAWEGRRADVITQFACLIPEFRPAGSAPAHGPSLRYVDPADVELEPDVADARPFGQTCPTCNGSDVHRSRARSLAERMKKTMTHERLFRCHGCGWRGWQVPNEALVSAPRVSSSMPDLDALDASAPEPALATPVFSPRNLK